MPLKIAMVGTGAMAERHAALLARHPGAELVTICSTPRSGEKAREFQRDFGFSGCSVDPAATFRSPNVEAVYLCSPDHTHPEFAAAALQAGKHVFCEKPLARTERGFETVRSSLKGSGLVLQVGMNCRFREQYSRPRRLIETGELGGLRFLRGVYLLNKVSVARARQKDWWLKHPPGIFFFLHANGVHILDLMRWFGGEVHSVFARASGFELGSDFRADTFSVSLQFHNGALGELLLSSAAFVPRDVSIQAWLERGSLMGTSVFRRVGDEVDEEAEEIPVEQERLDLEMQFDAFLESIRTGTDPMNNFHEAYQNFLLIRDIERSVEEGRVLTRMPV